MIFPCRHPQRGGNASRTLAYSPSWVCIVLCNSAPLPYSRLGSSLQFLRNTLSLLYHAIKSHVLVLDLDPFGDPVLMTKQDGAKSFDLTSLADSLADSRKDCKTPESFLDPAASSLVNLDSLVTAPQTSKTRNPFLSGRLWSGRAGRTGEGEPCWKLLREMVYRS